MGMNGNRLKTALLASVAVTMGASGGALAQENTAGEVVENVFTLGYSVGGTPQPGITNSDTNITVGGETFTSNGTGPTTFTVDRKVDLQVTALTGAGFVNNPAPGQSNVPVFYSVTNEGNDNFRYLLSVSEDTGDNVGTTNSATNPIAWYLAAEGVACDANGTYANTTAAVTTDIPAGRVVCVRVLQDIATDAQDGGTGNVFLTAETTYPGVWASEGATGQTAGAAVTADGNGANEIDGAAENVFLDDAFAATSDAAENGEHAAQGTLTVSAADLSATKLVSVIATDGSNCASANAPSANDQYAVPGACVEYVIRVENDGSNDATGVDIEDVLPAGMTFRGIASAGFSVAGTLTPAANATTCAETNDRCTVTLAGATLAKANGSPTVGTITIRATVD